MQEDSEVYVGLDTSKLKIPVALAAAGRDGEVRFFGDIGSCQRAADIPHFWALKIPHIGWSS